jgi:UV excision repair protein RAD23
LIFAGKILANDKTIEECAIKNDDFLVLMVKKLPAKPVATAPTPATTTAPPPSDQITNVKPPQTEPTVTSEQKNAAESLVTGSELEASIANIVAMGFPRELVVEAMKAAFNNPARAVDLLTSGFQPPQATSPQPAQQQPSSTPSVSPPQGSTASRPASAGGSVFDGLKQHPQFPMLCMLAQQGGQDALRQILEYFAQVSPPLLYLIEQNQEEFIRLLSTPVTQTEVPPASTPTGPTTPGVVRLTVTPEDERAIHNIVSMGFDRNRVLEAYFLFEKDEAQTINFLLNNPDNDN